MKFLQILRQRIQILLRDILLRGPLLNWWIHRKGRILEQKYGKALLSDKSTPLVGRIPAIPAKIPPPSLRRILFIADCMWEQSELIPELQKITQVSVLDLRPRLKEMAGSQPLALTVVETIKNFCDSTREDPDIIFFYARPSLLSEEAFSILRQRWKALLMGMNLDDKMEFFPYGVYRSGDDNYQKWAAHFEVNLTSCLIAEDWYRSRSLPVIYCPLGFHQSLESAAAPTSSDFKHLLSFVGSRKPERVKIIEQLTEAGVPIALFGTGWPNGGWIEKPVEVFRNTQLNLGMGFIQPTAQVTNVKARDFECPGTGACYLTTYNWELPNFYEIGKEILCYHSFEELLELYRFYSRRPDQCLQIAQAAHRRCAAHHTWEKRFRTVFREVGFHV